MFKSILKATAAISIILATNIYAKNTVSFIIASDHAKKTYCSSTECGLKFNEVNPGISIGFDSSEYVSYEVGFYKNSYRDQSIFAGVNYKMDFDFGGLTITPGVFLGGVSGYEKHQDITYAGIAPMILPNVSITLFDTVHVNVGILPPVGGLTRVYTFKAGFSF
jgi:hypothetical protein